MVLGIGTALCYAGYLLVIRRGMRDPRRPAGPVAVATLFTALAASVVGVVGGDLDPTPPLASLGWLAVLGVTSQSAGYLLISISLPRLPAVITSIILLAQPVMTVVLSMVLLGEAPSATQLLGVAPRDRRDRRGDGADRPDPRRAGTGPVGPNERPQRPGRNRSKRPVGRDASGGHPSHTPRSAGRWGASRIGAPIEMIEVRVAGATGPRPGQAFRLPDRGTAP